MCLEFHLDVTVVIVGRGGVVSHTALCAVSIFSINLFERIEKHDDDDENSSVCPGLCPHMVLFNGL